MSTYKFLVDNFVAHDLKIFPIKNNAKEPLIDRWQLDASCDKSQILYWLEYGEHPNFALPASLNNLFIIDIDMHGDVDGMGSFNALLKDVGLESMPKTLTQTTPSGGLHLIFKSDEELKKVRNTSNSFGEKYPGIDIRTSGYILVEPSVINGVPYKFHGNVDDISEMPKELRDFILENMQKNKVEHKEFAKKNKVMKGSRDDELFSYVNHLYYSTKLDYEEIKLLAHAYNDSFEPPLGNSVVDYKVNKLFEKERPEIIIVRLSKGDCENE